LQQKLQRNNKEVKIKVNKPSYEKEFSQLILHDKGNLKLRFSVHRWAIEQTSNILKAKDFAIHSEGNNCVYLLGSFGKCKKLNGF